MLSQEKFPKLKNFSLEVLSLFVSTYVREAAFFTVNIKKSRMRNRLENSSLESCLRLSLTGLPTDIDKLAAQKRLNYLINYIRIIIIVLVYWFKPIPVAARSRRKSAAAWLLGSQVLIPLRAWKFVSCVYMLCCPV
jgi:hypothetical protein